MDADNAHEIAAPCKILHFIYWSVGESEVIVSDLASWDLYAELVREWGEWIHNNIYSQQRSWKNSDRK